MSIDFELPERAVFKPPRPSDGFELADVIDRFLPAYQQRFGLSADQRQAVKAIRNCRTSRQGIHTMKCSSCDYYEVSFNSCRNRHCPKCQHSARSQWVSKQLGESLPVYYYHVVFTLPHCIHPLCRFNARLFYDLLFECASQTLLAFARDPKWLGAEPTLTMILHTWGQTLSYHPHLHVIMSGGGLSEDQSQWKHLPYQKKFAFPVKALSMVMRGKFLAGLRKAYRNGELRFPGKLEMYAGRIGFIELMNELAGQAFVVYAKSPLRDAEDIVKYLGAYTYQTAISNRRIQTMEGEQVHFSYKDYRDDRKRKTIAIDGLDFLRRFLQHVLPSGFKRIRHYGILAPGQRQVLLERARQLLRAAAEVVAEVGNAIKRRCCPECEAPLCFDEHIPGRYLYNSS